MSPSTAHGPDLRDLGELRIKVLNLPIAGALEGKCTSGRMPSLCRRTKQGKPRGAGSPEELSC